MKKLIWSAFNSAWIVTLVSTMIGVYAGIYLNNYFEKQSLLKSKEKAFNEVITELNDNHRLLEAYHDLLSEQYERASYILSYFTGDNEIVIPEDSLKVFLLKTETLFFYERSEPVKGGLRMRGDLNLQITSEMVARELFGIVWEAYKQTNYIAYTNFKCLTDLETIYDIQEEVNELNDKWMDLIFQGYFYSNKDKKDEYLRTWNQLLFKQRTLLQFYNEEDQMMENCRT